MRISNLNNIFYASTRRKKRNNMENKINISEYTHKNKTFYFYFTQAQSLTLSLP